jgi:hypothetical protein
MLSFFHFPHLSNTDLKTGWGTRAGIGDPTAATAAADKGDAVEKDHMQTPAAYSQTQQNYQQPAVEMQTGYAR